MRTTERIRRERGSQLVELGIILPIPLLLALFIIEGGTLVRTHQILNNGAREGVRVSTLRENRNREDAVREIVIRYADQNGIAISSAEVAVEQNTMIAGANGINIAGSRVTVTHTYVTRFGGALVWLGVPASFQLQAAAEFRNLY